MQFIPERLVALRLSLGINKAEAARRLNISAMGYGRYESGERVPSYQMVSYIAQTFHCSINYLYGSSDSKELDILTISASEEPILFKLIQSVRNDKDLLKRLVAYTDNIKTTDN